MASTPASVRFEPETLRRLNAFVAAHPGLSLSAAVNLLVDEATRTREHPLIVFREGPVGRRARLVPGPDVWEVIQVVREVRAASPRLKPGGLTAAVSQMSGVPEFLVRAAIAYWSAFPEEIDAMLERADRERVDARRRWQREQGLLAG